MKRIIIFLLLCIPVLGWAQSDCFMCTEETLRREEEVFKEDQERQARYREYMERLQREQDEKNKRLEENLRKAMLEAQQKAQKEREEAARQQAERNRQLAEQQRKAQQQARNQQIAARNQQIRAQNQQIAEHNRQVREQERAEAEARAKAKAEAERQRRMQIQQEVTAKTYDQLGAQTRSMQQAATWSSGAGADHMAMNHDVRNFAQNVQAGSGNAVSQIDHLPRQKFEMPSGKQPIIDPGRVYPMSSYGEYIYDNSLSVTKPVPPLPDVDDNMEQWIAFCDDMDPKRATIHISLMKEACGGELPKTIVPLDGYTAFLSGDENTVIAVKDGGWAIVIVHLDDPENAELRAKLSAEGDVGIFKGKVTAFDSKKVMENPGLDDISGSIDKVNLSKKKNTFTASVQVPSDSLPKIFDYKESYEKKDTDGTKANEGNGAKPNEEDDEKKKGIKAGIGAKAQLSWEYFATMKGEAIAFLPNSNKHGLYLKLEGGGGHKVETSLGANINTKDVVKAKASIGYEVFNASGDVGYVHVSKNNIHIFSGGGKFTAGPGFKAEANTTSLSAHAGYIGLGGRVNYKVTPLSGLYAEK